MNWILSEAASLQDELVKHRRWLHKHAEVGFQLPETIEYVRSVLTDLGIETEDCGKAGLVSVLGTDTSGKTLMLRADMDALPISEESDVSFACSKGNMHACGHDLHTAMLLGAAKLLKIHEHELKGRVKLVFQPAEEIFEGAKDMIRHNVLSAPSVDAAIMIHVAAASPIPSGTILICPHGVSAPAADSFTITVQGKGCHGSSPSNGIDALSAASHILIGLQEIHARELPASEEAVLTVGTFHSGTVPNVIADKAVLSGTIRSYSEESRQYLKTRIKQISCCISQAYRAWAKVEFTSGCPTLINNKELNELFRNCLKESHGSAMVLNAAEHADSFQGRGSEDFAYISHRIPSAMLALAAGQPDCGYQYPQHHPKVRFDESVLSKGTAAFVSCAFGYLSRYH